MCDKWEHAEPKLHLDTRSRWIPPEGAQYPKVFQCPFRGCEKDFASAELCADHVKEIGHPKGKQGNGKNWLRQSNFRENQTKEFLYLHYMYRQH